MYKTTAEVRSTKREIITVDMNGAKDNITISIREDIGCIITAEAKIDISPERFFELVYPVFREKGWVLTPVLEEI